MENAEVNGDEGVVRVNPELFSLSVIYSAAYVFLDKAYFSFGGDPEEEIKVSIKAKEGEDIIKIIKEFNNELVNYSVYEKQSDRNREIRKAIIERALATNLKESEKNISKVETFLSPEKKEKDE